MLSSFMFLLHMMSLIYFDIIRYVFAIPALKQNSLPSPLVHARWSYVLDTCTLKAKPVIVFIRTGLRASLRLISQQEDTHIIWISNLALLKAAVEVLVANRLRHLYPDVDSYYRTEVFEYRHSIQTRKGNKIYPLRSHGQAREKDRKLPGHARYLLHIRRREKTLPSPSGGVSLTTDHPYHEHLQE